MEGGVMNKKKAGIGILAAHLQMVVIREMLSPLTQQSEALPVASGNMIYYTGKAKQWAHAGCMHNDVINLHTNISKFYFC